MAATEARSQRDMAIVAVRTARRQLDTLLSSGSPSVRSLGRAIKRLRSAQETAIRLQTTYLARANRSVDDEEEVPVGDLLYGEVEEDLEAAQERWDELQSEQEASEAVESLTRRVGSVRVSLEDIHEQINDDLDPSVVDVLVREQNKTEETLGSVIDSFHDEITKLPDARSRGTLEAELSRLTDELIILVRRNLRALAPLQPRPRSATLPAPAANSRSLDGSPRLASSGVGPVGSVPPMEPAAAAHPGEVSPTGAGGGSRGRATSIADGGSPGGGRSQSAVPSAAGFRKKKYEFPKFNGEPRLYHSFRRDFREIAEKMDITAEWELSYWLRNESLQGIAREACANANTYEAVWRTLDDLFNDPQQVIDDVDIYLNTLRKLEESDYQGLIQLVDMLERARGDLEAAGQLAALQNPTTCRLVESRCPDWVQRGLVAYRRAQAVPSSDFVGMLEHLVELRSDARRLQSRSAAARRNLPPPGGRDRRQITVAAAPTVPDMQSGARPSRCVIQGCRVTEDHYLARCPSWAARDADGKAAIVRDAGLCILCFSAQHNISQCPRKSRWRPCGVGGCRSWHNRSIHGPVAHAMESEQNAPPPHAAPSVALTVNHVADGQNGGSMLMLAQEVVVGGGTSCRVYWDSGAGASLITRGLATTLGLVGPHCLLSLLTISGEVVSRPSMSCHVRLTDTKGRNHTVQVYTVDQIAGPVAGADLAGPHDRILPNVKVAPIDLLLGLSAADLHPVRQHRRGKHQIYSSQFGSGWLAAGGESSSAATACWAGVAGVAPMDFITAEQMGVELPRRCRSCVGCKECSFKTTHLSWQESRELAIIERGLSLDPETGKWRADYPFAVDPSVLQDNRGQAMALMERLERRLHRSGRLEEFCRLFKEAEERGVFVELAEEARHAYKGPVNYVSLVEAFKEGPGATTPLRLCVNSSLKFKGLSLNEILYKGPSALNDLFGVLLNFRKYPVALVKDIKKFYNSVNATTRVQHLRRLVWRHGAVSQPPKTFITATVNFGDRPAGCIAQVALRETAKLRAAEYPEAAECIINFTYVDDLVGGAETVDRAKKLSAEIDCLAAAGGFQYNPHRVSVVATNNDELPTTKVLGMTWEVEQDNMFVGTRVNFGGKTRGRRLESDITEEDIQSGGLLQLVVTRRLIWRIALGQYDPLGLLAPFLLRLKLLMRALSGGGPVDWDGVVDDSVKESFINILGMIIEAGRVPFKRAVSIASNQGVPSLVTFVDGSHQASCAVVYIRWPGAGSTGCPWTRLVAAKTRVAPLKKLTIPRLELQAAVIGARLAQRVEQALGFELQRKYFFTDSTSVLAMIKGDTLTFPEFVANRVAEVRSRTEPTQWLWVGTEENVADLGTRGSATPQDLGPTSIYQNGPTWLRCMPEEWPVKDSSGELPPEEIVCRTTACAAIVEPDSWVAVLERARTVHELVARMALAIMAARVWAGKEPKPGSLAELQQRSGVFQSAAWRVWIAREQVAAEEAVKHGALTGSRLRWRRRDGVLEVMTASERVGHDADAVPIVTGGSALGRLVMKDAHEVQHAGAARTIARSRGVAWILGAAKLARDVQRGCYHCRRIRLQPVDQLMAPLPPERALPSPPFHRVAIDLFGPVQIKDSVRGRVRRDTYGMLLVCMASTAIHVEVLDDYSAASVLLALRRFMAIRGTPALIRSDPGPQLVAASRSVGLWCTTEVMEFAGRQAIRWDVISAASQHQNGLAERMIGLLKPVLRRLTGGACLNKGELDTVVAEATQIVNSRPLDATTAADGSIMPLTPNHLLSGRATAEIPSISEETPGWAGRRVKFLHELRQQFWSKWEAHVLPQLLKTQKWRNPTRNVRKGDVVMIRYESKIALRHKLAVVTDVKISQDNVVRSVSVKYANISGDQVKSQTTTRSVHNIVVLVPVEEQGKFEHA